MVQVHCFCNNRAYLGTPHHKLARCLCVCLQSIHCLKWLYHELRHQHSKSKLGSVNKILAMVDDSWCQVEGLEPMGANASHHARIYSIEISRSEPTYADSEEAEGESHRYAAPGPS